MVNFSSVLFSFALTLAVACGKTPDLFLTEEYNPAILAKAVNHYVSIGEKASIQELNRLSPDLISESGGDPFARYRRATRIGWVCRILFEPKPGAVPLRQPSYGALSLPYLSMPQNLWPLYPLVRSGSSYLVLADGYLLGGVPENPKDYLRYCRTTGVFRKAPVPVPTKQQALSDTATLWESAPWKAIRWKAETQGTTYSYSEDYVRAFLTQQAEAVGTSKK